MPGMEPGRRDPVPPERGDVTASPLLRRKLSIFFIGLLLGSAFLRTSHCNLSSADVDRIKILAEANRKNRASIRTWSGKFEILDERKGIHEFGGQEIEERSKRGIGEFAYDADREALRWNRETVSHKGKQGGKSADLFAYKNSGMLADGAFHTYERQPEEEDQPHRVLIQDKARIADRPRGESFHPMEDAFWLEGMPADGWLAQLAGSSEDYLSHWSLDVQGEEIALVMTGTDNAFTLTYKFDTSKGGNLVLVDQHSNTGPFSNKVEYEYEEVSGCYVPLRWVETEENDGEFQMRERRILAAQVNQPLDDSAFTLAAMGVQPGDLVMDTRADLHYVYKNPSLEKPPEVERVEPVDLGLAGASFPENPTPEHALGDSSVAGSTPETAERRTQDTPEEKGLAIRTVFLFAIFLCMGLVALWRYSKR